MQRFLANLLLWSVLLSQVWGISLWQQPNCLPKARPLSPKATPAPSATCNMACCRGMAGGAMAQCVCGAKLNPKGSPQPCTCLHPASSRQRALLLGAECKLPCLPVSLPSSPKTSEKEPHPLPIRQITPLSQKPLPPDPPPRTLFLV